jgi:heat shock protein beta
MKKGQPQIYFMTGTTREECKSSPFVEKLSQRGYEVLYMVSPIDEYVVQSMPEYSGKKFQSVAKAGLKYGDEDKTDEEKEKELADKFKPLSEWAKGILGADIKDVVVSNRLTSSPCAVVAQEWGASGVMERILHAQKYDENDPGKDHMLKQPKIFEINPVFTMTFLIISNIQLLRLCSKRLVMPTRNLNKLSMFSMNLPSLDPDTLSRTQLNLLLMLNKSSEQTLELI